MSRVTIVENKYTSVHFDEDLNLYEQVWNTETEDMEEEEYKDIITQLIATLEDKVDSYIIHNYLLDNRNFLFSMSPEMQEWNAKNSTQFFVDLMEKQGLDSVKNAIIVSADFISQLSIEQAFEENQEGEQYTKYFEEEQEAREWLFDI